MTENKASFLDYLKAWPLYLLPQHLISRLVYRLTRWRTRLKDPVVRWFIRRYQVEMSEAMQPNPAAYQSFNEFFTRALKHGARPVVKRLNALACPADSAVSQFGRIQEGRIIQAKGHDYSVLELLGGDEQRAQAFHNGHFINLYLSPRDYHRIHAPWDVRLLETVYIPGRLFSVAPHTTRAIPRLFARNERLVCLFESSLGPLAVVLVGAINVGSIETVWGGEETPRKPRALSVKNHRTQRISLRKGAELGRFNLGSTVILLLPDVPFHWAHSLENGQKLRMGAEIGLLDKH
ncbi:archaetidylserine decarboxylase [Thiorhodospira sibirica]|uniref:archaetidylserine decarboxylase n=1 Tax=Thiorhodospira sibirica TaxID=154347 RepID=UPI00022C4C8B|nr:archaetidylserine decarboxylase [Thiorhodospira sibirica]